MGDIAFRLIRVAIELAAAGCAVALAAATWAWHAENPSEPSETALDRWLTERLGAAGVEVDPKTAKTWAALGAIAAALAMLALGVEPPAALAGTAAAALAAAALLAVRSRRTARSFSGQLGDALPVVAAGLRSGLSLPAALDSYCKEADNPIRAEFQRVSRDVGVGIPFHEALLSMSERMSSKDARQLATAVRIQARTGSGLADIIDHIAASIKERERLRAKARSLTSTNRMSAKLLTVLPILLISFFVATNERFRTFYLGPEGMWVGVAMAGMLAVGSLLLHRITTFRVD